MSTIELDWRTGDLYIDPIGRSSWLDGLVSIMQSIVNALKTWKGSDRDYLDFGPDWYYIFTLPNGEDPNPYITVELTRTLNPIYDSRIRRIDGIYTFDRSTEDGRRYFEIEAQVITENGDEIQMKQVFYP